MWLVQHVGLESVVQAFRVLQAHVEENGHSNNNAHCLEAEEPRGKYGSAEPLVIPVVTCLLINSWERKVNMHSEKRREPTIVLSFSASTKRACSSDGSSVQA